MKSIIGIFALLAISTTFSTLATSPGKEHGEPIVFEIVSEDVVEVNGVKASVKKSWVEANKYIDPDEINLYKIKNASEYAQQADVIVRNMNIVAEGAGVEIERAK